MKVFSHECAPRVPPCQRGNPNATLHWRFAKGMLVLIGLFALKTSLCLAEMPQGPDSALDLAQGSMTSALIPDQVLSDDSDHAETQDETSQQEKEKGEETGTARNEETDSSEATSTPSQAGTSVESPPGAKDDRCATDFHDIPVGGEACGLRLTEDRLILLDGKEISRIMQRSQDEPAESQKLRLFPISPSGRFVVLGACNHKCRQMLLIDRQRVMATPFNAGNYSPADWFSWSGDEDYLILISGAEGGGWLHVLDTRMGYVQDTPFAVYSQETLRWLSTRVFEVRVGACEGEFCDDTSVPEDLSRVELELTDFGIDTLAIEEPGKAPVEMRNALLERRILRGEPSEDVDQEPSSSEPLADETAIDSPPVEQRHIELKDGTRLTGEIQSPRLYFESSFGSMEIEPTKVQSFGSGQLELTDGSILNADLGKGDLVVETSRGELEIKMKDIVEISRVIAAGGGPGGPKLIAEPGQGILTGRVLDNFGQPVKGASVRIAGSSLSAETDESGHYSLAYSPGRFFVEIDHAGHDPSAFNLELASATTFPVEDKTLVSVPAPGRIYYQNQTEWSELGRCWVRKVSSDSGEFDQSGEERYVAEGDPLLIVSDEMPAFLDMTGIEGRISGNALSLYPVAPDGTIIRIRREAGFSGFFGGMEGSNEVTSPVSLFREKIGSGMQVHKGELSSGLYAFVPSVRGSNFGNTTPEDSCFLFQIKTVEQLTQENLEKQRLAQEINAKAKEWIEMVSSRSQSWRDEDWKEFSSVARDLNDLLSNPLAPRLSYHASIQSTAEVGLELAREAFANKQWEQALIWAKRTEDLNVDDDDAIKLRDLAAYEKEAQTARTAFKAKKWPEVVSAAKAALRIRPDNEELLGLKKRAEFESLAMEARSLGDNGLTEQARSRLAAAMDLRRDSDNFDLPDQVILQQDRYYAELTKTVAALKVEVLVKKAVPYAREIDEALELVQETISLGEDQARIQMYFSQINEALTRSGGYLGRYTSQVLVVPRSEQDEDFKRFRHGAGRKIKQVVIGPNGDSFYLIKEVSTSVPDTYPLTELKLSDASFARKIADVHEFVGHDPSNGTFFFRTDDPFIRVYGLDSSTGSKTGELKAGSAKTVVVTSDRTIVVLSKGAFGPEAIAGWRDGNYVFNASARNVCSLALKPDGKQIVLGMKGGAIRIYEVSDKLDLGKPAFELHGPDSGCPQKLEVASDGSRLLFESSGHLIVASLENSQKTFQMPSEGLYALNPKMSILLDLTVAAEGTNANLRSIDIASGEEVGSFAVGLNNRKPTAVAVTPDANTVFIGFDDGSAEVFAARLPSMPQINAGVSTRTSGDGDSQINGGANSENGSDDESHDQSSDSATEVQALHDSSGVETTGCGGCEECFEDAQRLVQEGDLIGAKQYYQRLARKGSVPANVCVARMHDPEIWSEATSPEKEPNWEIAAYWYEKAARQGDLEAQLGAGRVLCRHGTSSLDHSQGIKWLEQAVASGAGDEAQAMLNECKKAER